MRRSTAALVLLLVLFFLLKVLRFQTLAYTFHDMYVFLQMATGWMDGRPFMYDNFWGYHWRIHNYYTVWLLGPLCYQIGVYGFFVVQSGLLLLAYGLTNERLAKAAISNWSRYGLLAVVLLGPIPIWLNDHTSMGWHSELTYLPFGMLFALALLGRGWVWPLIAGLGVALVKEDGAVLAATIQLACFGIGYLRQHPGRSLWPLLTERRFWFISLGWGAVFIAGMVWLGYQNNFAEPRLRVALHVVAQNVDTVVFWRKAGSEFSRMFLLLLPIGGFLVFIIRQVRLAVGKQLLVVYGLGIAVLVAMNFVQGAFYYDDPYLPAYHLLGLTWPPRFVLPWTFTVAFLMGTLLTMPLDSRPQPTVSTWLILGGLLLIQLPILKLVRPDLPGLGEVKALAQGHISPLRASRYLDPGDLSKIQCLAEHLPARSDVMAYEYMIPYFHKHYLVWPLGHNPRGTYREADLAVLPIDAPRSLQLGLAATIRRPYRTVRLKGYVVYVASDYEPFINACLR